MRRLLTILLLTVATTAFAGRIAIEPLGPHAVAALL